MQLLRSSLNKGATRHGAYGTITGARSFICAATNKEAASLLQVGYMMEDVVLFLTLLGLDTCWMAGTFSQTKFRSAAQVAPDEILPIVTEVGKPGLIRNPVDFLINPTQGIHRSSWEHLFCADDLQTPLSADVPGEYSTALKMVRLAPSASNKQLWRAVRREKAYHFYLLHDPMYADRYPYDVQKVDMRIAKFHFEITALESGLCGSWVKQDPGIEHPPSTSEYVISWRAEKTIDA